MIMALLFFVRYILVLRFSIEICWNYFYNSVSIEMCRNCFYMFLYNACVCFAYISEYFKYLQKFISVVYIDSVDDDNDMAQNIYTFKCYKLT